MAWTTPATWVAGAVATAAQMNAGIRDNFNAMFPLGAPAWTSYTPVLTQSGAVTKTVTYARYTQIGKTVHVEITLAVTGAGSANNAVTVSLPVTAASASSQPIGSGYIVDASAVANYPGVVTMNATTTATFLDATQPTGAVRLGQTGSAFSAAFASGDSVGLFATYEAA